MTKPAGAPRAYADESFQEHAVAGFYVLAAAVFETHACAPARELLLDLRRELHGPRATDKLHWTQLHPRRQEFAVKMVGALDCFHVVVLGSPVPNRRQERARAGCLTRLVYELHALGVDELCLEAREDELNERDLQTAMGARLRLPRGARFRVEHERGRTMPLLWAADVVAGAVRAELLGNPQHRDQLGDRIRQVEVTTRC